MKADPFAQLTLLDVQRLDSRLDTIAHQRRTLPELRRLAEGAEQRKQLNDRVRDLRVLVSDLTREQKRADADVEQVKARRERDRARLDSGAVTNPKDLERMQHEMVSLERRISDLEDVELEVMQRLEDATAELEQAETQMTRSEEETTSLEQARDSRDAELAAEATSVQQERESTARSIPEDLVALYERLRASKGGVGAAELRARRCGGCRLTLDAAGLGAIARADSDEVVRCEECSRILVRTAESGL